MKEHLQIISSCKFSVFFLFSYKNDRIEKTEENKFIDRHDALSSCDILAVLSNETFQRFICESRTRLRFFQIVIVSREIRAPRIEYPSWWLSFRTKLNENRIWWKLSLRCSAHLAACLNRNSSIC